MTKKEKQKEYKPSKWIYIIMFIIPIAFICMFNNKLDNDIWYLLSEGRYIVNHGIYHIDPLSMHEGLQVVVQNWLSASIFYIIYSAFGGMGLFTTILICNFFVCLLLYKICMLISDKNYILSLLLMFTTDLLLVNSYMVSRPQIFSYIVLLGTIYVLELYIKTENWKYLIWIPVLSVIEINMHASLWLMMFLYILPYLIDSFKTKYLKTQGYPKKYLFIFVGIGLVVGLINPYFYKAITFIFTSFTDKIMHSYINELLPFSITTTLGKQMALIILLVGLIFAFFREGNMRVRYICLFAGTVILGFISYKGFSNFILVALFPLAYFFKDMIPKDFGVLPPLFKEIFEIMLMCVGIICIALFGYSYVVKTPDKVILKHDANNAIKVLVDNFDPKDCTVYSSFNNGGFVEFHGFKPYIDPRAEVFLKINNKKEDIFAENYYVQMGVNDANEFLEKYNFTHLLVESGDRLYKILEENENYFILYENTETTYRVFARNDMVSKEERERIIKEYEKMKEESKKEQEEKEAQKNNTKAIKA